MVRREQQARLNRVAVLYRSAMSAPGAKRKWFGTALTSGFDPDRTSVCCSAAGDRTSRCNYEIPITLLARAS